MRKLDYNEFLVCKILGEIFEMSIEQSNLSSLMFIRRFMTSKETNCFFNLTYLVTSSNKEDVIYELNDKYEPSKKKEVLPASQMYWIGYIYGALSYLYELSNKNVYQLFPAQEIVKYYNIYHTFDIEEAAERMMENIGYSQKDNTECGTKIMKKLFLRDELTQLIGKEIKVYIDRPVGSEHNGIVYPINYGHVKEFVAADKEFQDAYVLGVNSPIETFTGKVIGFVSRFNDIEDKLLVSNRDYTIKEINKLY